MQTTIFKKRTLGLLGVAVLSVIFLAAAAPKGADQYSIYLNNKLIMKRYVGQPLTLKSLALDKANENDKLEVHYTSCHGISKDRRIQLKDDNGAVLQEWKFADNAGGGMSIPVKELLQWQKKNPHVNLFYASQQLPAGCLLVGLSL